MPNDNEQRVRTRTLSWRELAQKGWGKEWNAPEVAYEFSGGRKFNDGLGPYGQIIAPGLGVAWDNGFTWDNGVYWDGSSDAIVATATWDGGTTWDSGVNWT